MPPLPGPDWITPRFGDLTPLAVQRIDERLFSALGIASRQGYAPLLLPTVQPVVVLPLEESQQPRPFMLCTTIAATAAQYGHVQLLNPSSSGVDVLVHRVSSSAATAGGVQLVTYNTALGTTVGRGYAKDGSGAASAAIMYRATDVALLGTTRLDHVFHPANSARDFILAPDPIRLRAGQGLLVRHEIVNVAMNAGFQWSEEAAA